MSKQEDFFDNIEKILDREESSLLESRKSHHSSWDNHIITLSTAAIGFCFTFLSFKNPCYVWLFYLGVFGFVISIISAMLNYIVADRGANMALHDHTERRNLNNEARHRVRMLQREVNEIGGNGDQNAVRLAQEKCDREIDAMFTAYKDKSESGRVSLDRNNSFVNFLNYSKTISFLAGIILVSFFASMNLDKLTAG